MDLNAEDYYRAALERLKQARLLYSQGESYAYAMYTAGLAVECMLRAFRWRKDPTFEGRHDLTRLYPQSGLEAAAEAIMEEQGIRRYVIEEQSRVLAAAANAAAWLWSNTLRFAPDDRVRKHLKKAGRYKGKKGDVLKANALDLLRAAKIVVERRIAVWASGKR